MCVLPRQRFKARLAFFPFSLFESASWESEFKKKSKFEFGQKASMEEEKTKDAFFKGIGVP